jgi:hypothetical protein
MQLLVYFGSPYYHHLLQPRLQYSYCANLQNLIPRCPPAFRVANLKRASKATPFAGPSACGRSSNALSRSASPYQYSRTELDTALSPRKMLFLDLPYDLREIVYVHVFATDRVYDVQMDQRSTWACLALTCRCMKHDLENIPVKLLYSPVHHAWAHSGAPYAMHTPSLVSQTPRIMTVRVPRCAISLAHEAYAPLLVRFISIALSLNTLRTTIIVYNDHTPLLTGMELFGFVRRMFDLLEQRESKPRKLWQNNPVNIQQVVFQWPDTLAQGHIHVVEPVLRFGCDSRIPKTWSISCPDISCSPPLLLLDEGFAVSSPTRFRIKGRRRPTTLEPLSPSTYQRRYT